MSNDSGKIEAAARRIVREACAETESGSWYVYAEEIPAGIHIAELAIALEAMEEVAEVDITVDGIDLTLWGDYCPNAAD